MTTCPTCSSPVRVHTSNEGTSFYEPVNPLEAGNTRLREPLEAIAGEPIYGVDEPAGDEDGEGHTGQEWAFLRWIDLTKEVARSALSQLEEAGWPTLGRR